MSWTWVRGEAVVVGYAPDGDSVRFVPENLETLRGLTGGDGIEPDADDGSVQLRLDAIDAPEKAYQGASQPLALPARDDLLARIGFTGLTFDDEETVTASTPSRVPVAIAASLVEANGRPVALLFTGDDATAHADGDAVPVDAAMVDSTVNATLARSGRAYLTLYSTTPEPVRARFVALAREAGAGTPDPPEGGVWSADRSAGFTLTSEADIGPDGALVLPKLFRRATDYLAADSEATFDAWLADQGEDDDPVDNAGTRTTLSALITQDGDRISLNANLLDLVFVE